MGAKLTSCFKAPSSCCKPAAHADEAVGDMKTGAVGAGATKAAAKVDNRSCFMKCLQCAWCCSCMSVILDPIGRCISSCLRGCFEFVAKYCEGLMPCCGKRFRPHQEDQQFERTLCFELCTCCGACTCCWGAQSMTEVRTRCLHSCALAKIGAVHRDDLVDHDTMCCCLPLRTGIFLAGLLTVWVGFVKLMTRWASKKTELFELPQFLVGGYSLESSVVINLIEASGIGWGWLAILGTVTLKTSYIKLFNNMQYLRLGATIFMFYMDLPLLYNCELWKTDLKQAIQTYGWRPVMFDIAVSGTCVQERTSFMIFSFITLLIFAYCVSATARLVSELSEEPRYVLATPKGAPSGAFYAKSRGRRPKPHADGPGGGGHGFGGGYGSIVGQPGALPPPWAGGPQPYGPGMMGGSMGPMGNMGPMGAPYGAMGPQGSFGPGFGPPPGMQSFGPGPMMSQYGPGGPMGSMPPGSMGPGGPMGMGPPQMGPMGSMGPGFGSFGPGPGGPMGSMGSFGPGQSPMGSMMPGPRGPMG